MPLFPLKTIRKTKWKVVASLKKMHMRLLNIIKVSSSLQAFELCWVLHFFHFTYQEELHQLGLWFGVNRASYVRVSTKASSSWRHRPHFPCTYAAACFCKVSSTGATLTTAPHRLVWSQVSLPRAARLSEDRHGQPLYLGTSEEQLMAYSRLHSLPITSCTAFIFCVKKVKVLL